MPGLPVAARLSAWGGAALAGLVGPDRAADEVAGRSDAAHRVSGLPGQPEPVLLSAALTRLRSLGHGGLRLALPVPGDVAGLPGPPAFNEEAVARGAAVLGVGGAPLGLLPAGRGAWRAVEVLPSQPPTVQVSEAERDLTGALREAADELGRLDVGRWDPAALELVRASSAAAPRLPPATPPAAVRLAAQAGRMLELVGLALTDDGASVSAREAQQRSAALRELARAARRAMEVACSAPGGAAS